MRADPGAETFSFARDMPQKRGFRSWWAQISLLPEIALPRCAEPECRNLTLHLPAQLAPGLAFSGPVSPDAQGFAGSEMLSLSFKEVVYVCFKEVVHVYMCVCMCVHVSPYPFLLKSQQHLCLSPWQALRVSDRHQY